jgi:16S rRNA (guanine1516-N2)-methyltransferase
MAPRPRYAGNGVPRELAAELGLVPLPDGAPSPPPDAVVVERDVAGRLAVRLAGDRPAGAVAVDFRSADFERRLAEGKRGLLGRAVGLAKGERPNVFDATAGFGRDAMRLAALGATVVAFERDPVVHALLADGLSRLRAGDDPLALAARERLDLRREDARDALRVFGVSSTPPPDAILLDPMFPERGSALAKKEAQLLQALLGEGADPAEDAALFAAALAARPRRIVVKRPRHAPPIVPAPEPSHRFEGKSVRYDLYLPG